MSRVALVWGINWVQHVSSSVAHHLEPLEVPLGLCIRGMDCHRVYCKDGLGFRMSSGLSVHHGDARPNRRQREDKRTRWLQHLTLQPSSSWRWNDLVPSPVGTLIRPEPYPGRVQVH